jgi:phospholipid/cholesterol/gamma-HCH transport system ATP-binding protein
MSFAYGDNVILKDVTFAVHTGDTFVIVGECGFGKSTILKLCCGLLRPRQGSVFIRGQDTRRAPHEALMELRLDMGYVFQGSALISNMSVYNNISLPLQYHTRSSKAEIDRTVRNRIELLNLKGYEHAMPASLSTGVMKRAAVARALALMPSLMLYDEPTSALDPLNAALLNDIIRTLHSGFGMTSVIVTHDMDAALELGTRIVLIADKTIVFSGTPDECRNTDSPYLQRFFKKA